MPAQPDLHTHSAASDGVLEPAELVVRAVAAGVKLLALTDHDTTAGFAAAKTAAEGLGVELVPGVEISVTWGGRAVHILGLGIDPQCGALQQGLAGLRDYRRWRAEEIGRRLAKAGIEGAYRGAAALSRGDLVGRTHFARFLVGRGLAADVQGVFKRFLTKGNPGHVHGEWASLEEAVGWIRTAGGQAVIAHPGRYRFSRSKLIRLIAELKALGGVGIEVVSGRQGADEALMLARCAREHGLYASAGSDYHGPEYPALELGRLPPLPAGCVPIWSSWTPPESPRAIPA